MNRLVLLTLLVSLVAAPVWAQAAESGVPAARVKLIAPFLGEQTVGVVYVDLTRVNLEPLREALVKLVPDAEKEITQSAAVASAAIEQFVGAGIRGFYAVGMVTAPLSPYDYGFFVVPLAPGTDEAALVQLIRQRGPWRDIQSKRVGPVLVLGSSTMLAQLDAMKPTAGPEWERAFAAAGDATVRGVFVMPATTRRALEEMMPVLPESVGGGPSSVVTHGVLWAAVGANLSEKTTLRVVVQSQDSVAAEALLQLVHRAAERHEQVVKTVPGLEKLLQALMPKQEGDRLVLDAREDVLGALAEATVPAVTAARESAQRVQSMNHMKQLGLAMHNYHEVKKTFPPAASRDAQGKPLLSWRVHILPYLEEPGLYEQFHLDEPWDSPHNKALLAQMPQVFRSPASKSRKPGYTNYVVPVGPGTVFEGPEGRSFRDIRDGTSNTIMILEVDDAHAVPWTKPDDWTYDRENPTSGLGGLYPHVFHAALCDGSIHALALEVDPEVLRRLLECNDGKFVQTP